MKNFLTLILTGIVASTFGQNIHRCYTTEMMQKREQANPGYQKAVDKTFEMAKERAQTKSNGAQEIYRIPVVVHVVYNSSAENIPDSLIVNQIEVLNQAYRRTNPDTGATRAEFKPVAADAGIEFYLANSDPNGNWTNGINRVQTAQTSWLSLQSLTPDGIKSSAQGGVDAWPTDRYLNIWVGNLSLLGTPFILGFAYPPVGAPNWPSDQYPTDPNIEGVVVHYEVFGRNNPLASGVLSVANQGRTCVHEVGHFLGLRHIWGDGGGLSGTPGCSVDDGIDDTPNAAEASQQDCNLNKNSCTDSPVDFFDMIENYMDYSDESCMNMFTEGQVGIMRSIMETTRNDLSKPLASTSINEAGIIQSGLYIYPNPSKEEVNVSYDNSKATIESVDIYDSFGRLVVSHTNSQDFGNTNFTINTNDLSSGIYFLHFTSEKDKLVRKLVKK